MSKDCKEKSGKLNFCKKAMAPVKVSQAWLKSNLWQIHIPNFKSISQKTAEKSLKNWSVWRTDGRTDGEQTKSPPPPPKPVEDFMTIFYFYKRHKEVFKLSQRQKDKHLYRPISDDDSVKMPS